ncbi:B9 domain-containing protein 2-like [Limulus polyphemus]|uniref:B9 domain-containing protein 2 n=1 Tax=Limulus polyphemus TaxID=6850 RepID=A0ABM1BRS1_LIMPO|nr:B9 domain-containing protein 2-like [Limulus polyphemus]
MEPVGKTGGAIIGPFLKSSTGNSYLLVVTDYFSGGWQVLEGAREGQTQVDIPHNENTAYWCHPVDIHLTTRGLQGWPKFNFQVWHQDRHSRCELWGYGLCHIPTSPGFYQLECVTWRPLGTLQEEISRYFLGGGMQLCIPDTVYTGLDRYRFQTVAMGKVHLEISVVFRNFESFGVEY